MELGRFHWLVLSPRHIFVTYMEEAFYSSGPGELEANVLSVFSRDGMFELSLRDFLESDRDADWLVEIVAAYTYGDCIVFINWACDFVWMLDMTERKYRKVPISFPMVMTRVLSGNDKRAHAIVDNRMRRRHDQKLVPFELAVFDLESGTSVMKDFAPVEKELTASGFKMEKS